MRRAAPRKPAIARAIALGLAAWVAMAAPAHAWGSLTHALVGERAYGELVVRHPWLATGREAFLWGAIIPDWPAGGDRVQRARFCSEASLQSLWREARRSGDPAARAFVLGWAVHQATDELDGDAWLVGQRSRAFRSALAGTGSAGLPTTLGPLAEWAVDAALVPVAHGTLYDVYRAAATHAATPAGAPVQALLQTVLGVDEEAWLGWARLEASLADGDPEHYLAERARFERVEGWSEALQAPAARQALGDLTPLLARSVCRGVARVERLLEPADAGLQPTPTASTPKAPRAHRLGGL